MYPLLVHYHKIYFEGKSIKSQVKRITNRGEANVGREILTIKEDGVEENFLTADLIEKATPVVIKNDVRFGDLCFTKEKGTINKKFLLRHHNDADDDQTAFKFPTKCNETELFLTVDQRESLMEMRESVENEVAQKFLSNDTKVIIALKDVITEEFKKTDEKLDHISEQITSGTEELLREIKSIKRRLDRSDVGKDKINETQNLSDQEIENKDEEETAVRMEDTSSIQQVTDEETNQASNDVPMTTFFKSPLTGEEILTHHKNAKKRLKRRRCKICCCITPIILILALIVGIPLGIWIHAKVECQLSDWGPCNATCGEGAIKTRNVTIPAKNGGNCSQKLIESCNLKPCPGKY